MSEHKPIPAAMGTPREADSWDLFRAGDWDSDIQTVGQLLNVLGQGGHTEAQQAEALRAFMQTSPYIACPEPLRQQVQQFLEAQ